MNYAFVKWIYYFFYLFLLSDVSDIFNIFIIIIPPQLRVRSSQNMKVPGSLLKNPILINLWI